MQNRKPLDALVHRRPPEVISSHLTRDPELMEMLVASGCLGNVIGFESLDPRNLTAMNKQSNLLPAGRDGYEKACRVLRDHHLQTWQPSP